MIDETIIVGVARSSDGKEVYYEASDPKASYVLTNETDRSAWEWVDSTKIDYNYLPKPGSELQNTLIANHGLPLSFLQIQTVEEGAAWYKANSKYPDLVCEMMAKYEWGDLMGGTSTVLGLWRENYDAYPLCCRPTNAMRRQPSWWTRRENLLECPLLIRPLRERAINFEIA